MQATRDFFEEANAYAKAKDAATKAAGARPRRRSPRGKPCFRT